MKPEDRKITVVEAAELAGKSVKWVQNLVSEGFIERPTKGEYTLSAVLRGVVDYYAFRLLAKGGEEAAKAFVLERRAHTEELKRRK